MTTGESEAVCPDPADPEIYELGVSVHTDPEGPAVNGWELQQITYDCPTWISPSGNRVKVVRQAEKYALFARGDAIKHGSHDREDCIKRAVEWMRQNPAQQTLEGFA